MLLNVGDKFRVGVTIVGFHVTVLKNVYHYLYFSVSYISPIPLSFT